MAASIIAPPPELPHVPRGGARDTLLHRLWDCVRRAAPLAPGAPGRRLLGALRPPCGHLVRGGARRRDPVGPTSGHPEAGTGPPGGCRPGQRRVRSRVGPRLAVFVPSSARTTDPNAPRASAGSSTCRRRRARPSPGRRAPPKTTSSHRTTATHLHAAATQTSARKTGRETGTCGVPGSRICHAVATSQATVRWPCRKRAWSWTPKIAATYALQLAKSV